MSDSGTAGLSRPQFWLVTLMGVAALGLVGVNIVTLNGNNVLRAEVNERQQFINQGIKLSRLHNQLIQGLAQLSARTGDEQLRDVLSRNGISFTVKPASAPSRGAVQEQTTAPLSATQTEETIQ